MTYKKIFPGLVVASLIAAFSLYISSLHPSFDSLVISIIIGMLLGNLMQSRELFQDGMDIGTGLLLPVGIALYGAQLSVSGLKPGLVASIVLVFSGLFGLTLMLSKVFHLSRNISILLASGLSVCGASAIAIISPLIGAKREDTSISIISVMMLGLVGMIFYPLLNDFFPFTRDEFNFFAGSTLPMIGQVRVAAAAVCPECLDAALQIKLIRVSFLLFLVPALALRAGAEKKRFRIPWFVIVFVLLSVAVNTVPGLRDLQTITRNVSAFCFSAGLAAIGFSVDLDAIVEEGVTPLGVIFAAWTVVLIFIYLFRSII